MSGRQSQLSSMQSMQQNELAHCRRQLAELQSEHERLHQQQARSRADRAQAQSRFEQQAASGDTSPDRLRELRQTLLTMGSGLESLAQDVQTVQEELAECRTSLQEIRVSCRQLEILESRQQEEQRLERDRRGHRELQQIALTKGSA